MVRHSWRASGLGWAHFSPLSFLGRRDVEVAAGMPACPVSQGQAGEMEYLLEHWPCPSMA